MDLFHELDWWPVLQELKNENWKLKERNESQENENMELREKIKQIDIKKEINERIVNENTELKDKIGQLQSSIEIYKRVASENTVLKDKIGQLQSNIEQHKTIKLICEEHKIMNATLQDEIIKLKNDQQNYSNEIDTKNSKITNLLTEIETQKLEIHNLKSQHTSFFNFSHLFLIYLITWKILDSQIRTFHI